MVQTLWRSVALVLLLLLPGVADGDNEIVYGEDNNWARFGVGSWKVVRVYTETLDRQGKVEATSSHETRLTLDAVEDARYTLKVEVTIEAAGKRFVTEPKLVRRGFYGETNGQQVTVRKLGDTQVEISDRVIATELQEVIINGSDTRRVKRVYLAPTVAPFVLKQEVSATDAEGKVKAYEASSDVVLLDMPYKVLSQIKTAAFLRTIQRAAGKKIITLEVLCPEVPGGVVAHSSQELNANGEVVQRTTLELLDYEALTK